MANIKTIQVKVTYTVGLGNLPVSKQVLDQLHYIHDRGEEIDFSTLKYPDVSEWIIANIKERDCFESQFEITDLE